MENILKCKLEDLKTESDVEQKFILPLLIQPIPSGLNYAYSNFQTKPNIRGLIIGKGLSSKIYFPDYVIVNSGLPLIIEVKKPGEDIQEALREARLYCAELNSQFSHNLNPCSKIIVTTGQVTIAGFYDSSQFLLELSFDEINPSNPKFFKLSEFAGKEAVFGDCEGILRKIKGDVKFFRPLSMLGGKAIQNEQLNENTFGSTLSLDFRYLFNPESYEEKKNVVLNAYVKTKRHLRQVDPIDKIIRATLPLSISDLRRIEDTSEPVEVIKALQKRIKLKNQLLLLVGSVGSGKSTFTDYLKEVAISEELKSETVWVSFNLNQAPLSRNEIYEWLKDQIVEKLKQQKNDVDFDELGNLKKLYAVEINSYRKTYASLLGEDSKEYKLKFADEISKLKSNKDITAKAFTRYLCSEKGKLFIIVLDNTDKRKLEDQLLMFEVASWLKEVYNCLVFLPLRDTTFDNFRKQPPLDTVIKDFVFRIDPPLLREVIMARIGYALREMAKTETKLSFSLPNGILVEYPTSDQGFYLASIVKSLFESVYFSRLISGIAGRDIRKGLEIFLDFCKSGHINETEILQIRMFKGQYVLPNHLISRIILRGSMKYYSEKASNVKNIFCCFPSDGGPDPFIRLSLLRWLEQNFRKTGPTKNIGYHKISNIINELISYGHSEERLLKEIDFLIKSKYIVTESQSLDYYEVEDLVSISSSGMTLLDLLNDPNYLTSCAEDIYFRDEAVAKIIFERISERTGFSLYSMETTIGNSKDLLEYLELYKAGYLLRKSEVYLSRQISDYSNLDKQRVMIDKKINANESLYRQNQYPSGTKVDAEIVAIKEYGIFVEFGLDEKGFIHISEFDYSDIDYTELELGDNIKGSIKKFNSEHHRFELEFYN